MRSNSPFSRGPDDELGRLLGAELAGPDAEAYLGRLRQYLAGLPERDSQWEVLARWARPGVLVAAMAAGFLLGVALLNSWHAHRKSGTLAASGMPAAALMAPTATEPGTITFAVLEGR